MAYVLIAIVWLGTGYSVTMHDFSGKAECRAAARKVIELMNQNRHAHDRLMIAESCVKK